MMFDKFTNVPVVGISICVDFNDLLELTLPYNRHQFERFLVVTHPEDEAVIETTKLHGAELLLTEVFYSRGAKFNKWAALQQGLDFLNHDGWLCIIDCDIAIPQQVYKQLEPKASCLYTPRRLDCRILRDGIPPEKHWRRYKPVNMKEGFEGYFQMFHTSYEGLQERPWFRNDWDWAGTGDTIFQRRWPDKQQVRPPWNVMHLGIPYANWTGRVQPYADGKVPAQARERRANFDMLMRQRRLNHGLDDRYKGERLPGDNITCNGQ